MNRAHREVHSNIDRGLFRRLGLPEELSATSEEEMISVAVKMIESERGLRHDPLQPRREGLDAGRDLLLEVRMRKEFHHEVRQAALVGEPVDADDRGVRDRLCHLELVLEQLPLPGIAGLLWHDQLHGHAGPRAGVHRLPDLAVAAQAELGFELQWAESVGNFCHGTSGLRVV